MRRALGQGRQPGNNDCCPFQRWTLRPGAPAMRFRDYQAFKAFLEHEYAPLPEEVTSASEGYAPGANWAKRHAPRFFRALRAIEPEMGPGSRLLDIGTYPGSFPRLARACYGAGVQISACGMPGTHEFLGGLARDGIQFRACNLDPEVTSRVELPQGLSIDDLPRGLPFESNSIDVITCMEVVEHLFSLKTLLTECQRVLRPGGLLYITTNNIMDRVGLLRIFRSSDTNLDDQLEQTTIWSDDSSPWRGHVRFYSVKQLGRIGEQAGLAVWRSGHFQHFEDPDTLVWRDRGLLGQLRKWLRGRGDAPPVRLRIWLQSLIHLGPRSLSSRFNSHLELILRKAADELLVSPKPVPARAEPAAVAGAAAPALH